MEPSVKVQAVAAYLDEKHPGWSKNVNPLTLDLQSECDCICGQNSLDWGDVRMDVAESLGEDFAKGTFSARELETLWLEEIAKRLPATVPAEVVAA